MAGKKPRKDDHNFRPSFERLEDRTTPAGNLRVGVLDGILYIFGDSANNQFSVVGYKNREAVVRPTNGTTINGQSGDVFFGGIGRGYHIDTDGGNDTVTLEGIKARDMVNVRLGAGNDALNVNGIEAGKGLIVLMDNGNDTLAMRNSTIDAMFSLTGGNGSDTASFDNNTFDGKILMNGGPGTNTFTAGFNRIEDGLAIGEFTRVSTSTTPPPVDPGNPNDTTPPVATITTTATNPTALSSIPYTVTFNKPVTGFSSSDLIISNANLSNFTAESATRYTFTLAPIVDGAVSITVPAGAAVSAANVGNPQANASITSSRADTGMTNTAPNTNDPSFVPLGTEGLRIRDVVTGTGTAVVDGNSVNVFYSGWLASNGTLFDSRRSPNPPATFSTSGVIAGFRQALIGMQPGGIRQVFIPSALGYGAAGSPPNIPANADLIFEIKLISTNA